MSGWGSGEKCLVRDQDHGWATAVVTGSQGIGSEATLKLRLDDGGVLIEKLGSEVERLTNDKTLEETEDMAALENLSEATMLECLRRRYRRDRIYSSLGGVVVAINPFRRVEGLYGDGRKCGPRGGEANVEKVARRLMLLRADPALDDGHPDVRFPPLCAAVANGSTQLALLLLHAGSDPDVRTSDGRQAIHVLNLTRKEEDRATLLEALVNAGADVNATTNSGDAACHVAAREGLHDVLCRLLEFGANMMMENSDGLTPAEVAYIELQGDSSKDAGAWTTAMSPKAS